MTYSPHDDIGVHYSLLSCLLNNAGIVINSGNGRRRESSIESNINAIVPFKGKLLSCQQPVIYLLIN